MAALSICGRWPKNKWNLTLRLMMNKLPICMVTNKDGIRFTPIAFLYTLKGLTDQPDAVCRAVCERGEKFETPADCFERAQPTIEEAAKQLPFLLNDLGITDEQVVCVSLYVEHITIHLRWESFVKLGNSEAIPIMPRIEGDDSTYLFNAFGVEFCAVKP
jgi:hypothetical protein